MSRVNLTETESKIVDRILWISHLMNTLQLGLVFHSQEEVERIREQVNLDRFDITLDPKVDSGQVQLLTPPPFVFESLKRAIFREINLTTSPFQIEPLDKVFARTEGFDREASRVPAWTFLGGLERQWNRAKEACGIRPAEVSTR
jgi:hypothetical protein